jgi:hypothetical protein
VDERQPGSNFLFEDRPSDADLTKRAFARSRLLNPIELARDGKKLLLISIVGKQAKRSDLYFARPQAAEV